MASDLVRGKRRPLSSLIVRSTSSSTSVAQTVDAVALGSPHFSYEEFGRLEAALVGQTIKLPFYVCTGRHAVERLEAEGRLRPLEEAGVTLVTDTCVVVTPILPRDGGVLMTNSGKFAHYAPGTIGYGVVYGSLEDCVATAAENVADWSRPRSVRASTPCL